MIPDWSGSLLTSLQALNKISPVLVYYPLSPILPTLEILGVVVLRHSRRSQSTIVVKSNRRKELNRPVSALPVARG